MEATKEEATATTIQMEATRGGGETTATIRAEATEVEKTAVVIHASGVPQETAATIQVEACNKKLKVMGLVESSYKRGED